MDLLIDRRYFWNDNGTEENSTPVLSEYAMEDDSPSAMELQQKQQQQQQHIQQTNQRKDPIRSSSTDVVGDSNRSYSTSSCTVVRTKDRQSIMTIECLEGKLIGLLRTFGGRLSKQDAAELLQVEPATLEQAIVDSSSSSTTSSATPPTELRSVGNDWLLLPDFVKEQLLTTIQVLVATNDGLVYLNRVAHELRIVDDDNNNNDGNVGSDVVQRMLVQDKGLELLNKVDNNGNKMTIQTIDGQLALVSHDYCQLVRSQLLGAFGAVTVPTQVSVSMAGH